MIKMRLGLLVLLLVVPAASAQRQMEKLGRGVVAVRTGANSAYVGWRLLGTDPDNIGFNVLRSANGGALVQLNGALVTTSCNFTDSTVNFAQSNAYFLQPVVGGVTQALSAPFGLAANPITDQYINIPLQQPPGGTSADGVPYTYNANDCSAADLDGDGEYEIILKWDPTNSKDNSQSGFTGNVLLDAYKLNGTRLWRINLGPNIRAGAHYTQFMVYDLDGDGRAELACKTAPGSRDGLGNYLDGNAAFTVYTNSAGYILSGPEYFTIFDGLTGANLWTTNYIVPRGNVSDWGDSYGNRVDRFLACIAYLDGVRPSVVMCRGYYTRAALAAWDWRNGVLTQRWLFDTGHSGGPYSGYKGQGAHSLTVGDVDGDGKDEITFGACAIDDNGTGLYNTALGHGDALHQSDMHPDRPGLEVWMVHEDPGSYGSNGLEFRDAKNGALLFGVDGQNADVGRGVAIDIDPNYPGYEMWGSRGGLMSATGVQISSTKPGQQNFACWWDADNIREILDGTTITKWNSATSSGTSILSPAGLSSNNSTKSTPNLSVDLFGDWREEVIWRTSDNLNLRIYTTTTVATNRLVTLMHDPAYRLAIAWQNTAYNQPPHPGFYLGAGMYPPPVPPVSAADLVWRGGGANIWDAAGSANWVTNGVWSGSNPAVSFSNGRAVLFDLSGSNQSAITLNGTLSPGQVTVHSPKDYTFSGTGQLSGGMKLVKAGPGRLTLNNTNSYTGGTFVSGGALFVNGTLSASAVTVERRGTVEGPSQFGGAGRLGNGLLVQAGCTLIVGAATNAASTLTVTNTFTELGGVLNQFELSTDPAGIAGSNDLIQVFGNVVVSGTNILEITQPSGFLGGGVYPLIKYTGTLTGGLTNFVLSGNFVQSVALTNPPGMIALRALTPAAPPLAPTVLSATAVGAFQINLAWTDNSSDESAFLLERSTGAATNFVPIATLAANTTTYQDLGLAAGMTYFYRVAATNLAGFSAYSNTNSATTAATPGGLTWRGDGAGNVWDLATTANWDDGNALLVFNNGTAVTFNQSGSNNTAINLAETLQPSAVTVNATKNYTFNGAGALVGSMVLTKSGSGTLTLGNAGGNAFSGGIVHNAGNITLTSAGALGAGPITLQSNATLVLGTLSLAAANPLTVSGSPTITGGNSGGLTDLHAVSGSGQLNLTITTGVLDFEGNLGGFTGKIQFSGNNTIRFNGSTGSSSTEFDLGTGAVAMVKRNSTGTIPLGALAGGPNTTLQGASGSGNTTATTYSIGARNLNTTYQGTISNGQGTTSLLKTGTGVLTLTGGNAYTGTTIVSGGSLVINGNQTAANGAVTVNTGATLGGMGLIGGNSTINGRLSPGTPIGQLTFAGNLTVNFGAIVACDLRKNPLGSDKVSVQGVLTYGGSLDVLHTSIEPLEAGDRFQLFSAASYAGSFVTYQLPALDLGLAWNVTQLPTNGWLWVVTTNPPVITSFNRGVTNFTFSGTGGTPNWNYDVLTTTNVTVPGPQWIPAAAGQFDASGNFSVNLPINPVVPEQYFQVRVQ